MCRWFRFKSYALPARFNRDHMQETGLAFTNMDILNNYLMKLT